jgi:hypothetical protein
MNPLTSGASGEEFERWLKRYFQFSKDRKRAQEERIFFSIDNNLND